MDGDTLVETGPHLLPKLTTDSQQTIPEIRCDKSTLVQGAGRHEETPKVSRVYQYRANPSHTDDASLKGTNPTVPEYLTLMHKRFSVHTDFDYTQRPTALSLHLGCAIALWLSSSIPQSPLPRFLTHLFSGIHLLPLLLQ